MTVGGRGGAVYRHDAVHLLPLALGFGGLKTDQVKRLKEFGKDRAVGTPMVRETVARERLRKAVSDLTFEKLILREAASGNF